MYRATHLLCGYRKQDKKNGFGNVIDFDGKWIVDNILSKPCVHCGESDWTKIGCNRIDNSKPHTKDNVEPCCRHCNISLGSVDNNSKRIYQYTLDGRLLAIFPSTMEVERKFGFRNTNISKCCLGKTRTSKGYRWSYEPL